MKKHMKKWLPPVLAAAMLCAALPLGAISASAADIGRVEEGVTVARRTGDVAGESTLYLGELFVDGESALCYVYSDDLTHATLFSGGMNAIDDRFTALMPVFEAEDEAKGLAVCNDADCESRMNADWKDAAAAAAQVFPELTVVDTKNDDLYETDEAFAARCDEFLTEGGVELQDSEFQPIEAGGVFGILNDSSIDTTTFTVIDGKLVRIIDRYFTYTLERVTVVYTAAWLQSDAGASGGPDESDPFETSDRDDFSSEPDEPGLPGDANGDGSVDMKDVLVIRKFIANMGVEIDETAADVNRDGSVDMKDVLLIRKFIAGLIQSFER